MFTTEKFELEALIARFTQKIKQNYGLVESLTLFDQGFLADTLQKMCDCFDQLSYCSNVFNSAEGWRQETKLTAAVMRQFKQKLEKAKEANGKAKKRTGKKAK